MKTEFLKWETTSKVEVFRESLFSIVEKKCWHPDKGIHHCFFSMETPDWVNVVPITSDGRILLIKQHRLGTDEVTLETPGGIVDPGESPETAAFRELKEETGYQAKDIQFMNKLSANPAIMNNRIYFYIATGCVQTDIQTLDVAEDIAIETFRQDEITDMLGRGVISHSIVVTALLLYFSREMRQKQDTHR